MTFLPNNRSLYKEHPHPRWCVAIHGDTTECSMCHKQWDTNDPDEPDCLDWRIPMTENPYEDVSI